MQERQLGALALRKRPRTSNDIPDLPPVRFIRLFHKRRQFQLREQLFLVLEFLVGDVFELVMVDAGLLCRGEVFVADGELDAGLEGGVNHAGAIGNQDDDAWALC